MFKKKIDKPNKITYYPNNIFIQTENGYYYIVSNTRRHKIISKRVLDSWSPQRVVQTTEAATSNYKVRAKLRFRNGSLIHSISDGKIYLVSDGLRRHIQNPDYLTNLGATGKDVVTVSNDEINLHEEGEPLK